MPQRPFSALAGASSMGLLAAHWQSVRGSHLHVALSKPAGVQQEAKGTGAPKLRRGEGEGAGRRGGGERETAGAGLLSAVAGASTQQRSAIADPRSPSGRPLPAIPVASELAGGVQLLGGAAHVAPGVGILARALRKSRTAGRSGGCARWQGGGWVRGKPTGGMQQRQEPALNRAAPSCAPNAPGSSGRGGASPPCPSAGGRRRRAPGTPLRCAPTRRWGGRWTATRNPPC